VSCKKGEKGKYYQEKALFFLMEHHLKSISQNKKTKIMILTKGNPVNRNLNTVFDEIFNSLPYNVSKEAHTNTNTAPVNIIETANGYQLDLLAPGRNKEEFKINIEKGFLTISYENKQEAENKDEKFVRREFSTRSFKRSFSVDEKINADGIEARYDNGILRVFLPKKEEVKATPKQIQIQ
jgi:HSP20 family protein